MGSDNHQRLEHRNIIFDFPHSGLCYAGDDNDS
jgi:hypothetical protein